MLLDSERAALRSRLNDFERLVDYVEGLIDSAEESAERESYSRGHDDGVRAERHRLGHTYGLIRELWREAGRPDTPHLCMDLPADVREHLRKLWLERAV